MRRLLATSIALLLPLGAAAQSWPGVSGGGSTILTAQPATRGDDGAGEAGVPLWRGADGRALMLDAGVQPSSADLAALPPGIAAVEAGSVQSSRLDYTLAPSIKAHAGVSTHSWANAPAYRVLGSEVGATYTTGRYSLGLSVGNDTVNGAPRLPRVLPGALPGAVNGLSAFDSSTQLSARGRLALDSSSGIDLGASVGRIHLLPGNLMGVESLDQKALSVGIDRGPLSGSLVGRVMQPTAGLPGAYSPERRWSSIDLGVTFKLPWQGQLSVGAQNLWSSGTPANTPAGPEPDQSRTPYVQYHQDL